MRSFCASHNEECTNCSRLVPVIFLISVSSSGSMFCLSQAAPTLRRIHGKTEKVKCFCIKGDWICMDTLDRYCEECGAANARAATICFACARPLDDSPLEQAEEDAGEKTAPEDQPAAASIYVQFTLTANSQTTRKLVQP